MSNRIQRTLCGLWNQRPGMSETNQGKEIETLLRGLKRNEILLRKTMARIMNFEVLAHPGFGVGPASGAATTAFKC